MHAGNMTSAAVKLIAGPSSSRRARLTSDVGIAADYSIETFAEAELLVNITKHQLVPQHRVMSKDEKAALLDK